MRLSGEPSPPGWEREPLSLSLPVIYFVSSSVFRQLPVLVEQAGGEQVRNGCARLHLDDGVVAPKRRAAILDGEAGVQHHVHNNARFTKKGLASFGRPSYIALTLIAGWSSLVARQAHNLKVAGSNPAPATNFSLAHRAALAENLD